MKMITLQIEADMLLDAINHAVFTTDAFNIYANEERIKTFKNVAAQLEPRIEEPTKLGTVVTAHCRHIGELAKPARFVRWTDSSYRNNPWIASDGLTHSWSELSRVRLVK